ncbi:hypothetical protein D3C75_651060 [compost metagenome]
MPGDGVGVGTGVAVGLGVGVAVGAAVGVAVASGVAVGVTAPDPYTSSSATWPAVAPVLAVMFTLTYLAEAAVKETATVLFEAGLNV